MSAPLSKTDRLLFTYGDIQVSPQQVVVLNKRPPSLFKASFETGGNGPNGYQVLTTGYCDYILENEETYPRELNELEKLLVSLRSSPRPPSAFSLKGSTDTWSIKNDYYRVDYRISSGQVQVFNIQLTTRLQRLRDAQETVALYKVSKREGVWTVQGKTASVGTPIAAVNGQSNNLAKATWLMGNHLEVAFGKQVQEYTLFHNPSQGGPADTWESFRDKLGFTTPVTKQFAKTLEATQQTGNETSWVAHSQGGIIFSEGVRYLLNSGSSLPLNNLNLNGVFHPEKGTLLDKHSVALHGNANNNWRSGHLFDRAGIKVLAVRAHDYDFVHQVIGANTVSPRKIAGSLTYLSQVTNGSIAQSPHTTIQSMSEWRKNMKEGPGKGRSPIQKRVHQLSTHASKAAQFIDNYLP